MHYGFHQSIPPFALHRPRTVADAVAAHGGGQGGDGAAVYLAGGVDLIPAMRAGQRPQTIVWLGAVAGLTDISVTGDMLQIGGGATYRQIETDPAVAAAIPGLAQVWAGVANIRVREAGTFCGNIMAGNPGYDALPAALALGASFQVADAGGERQQPADQPVPAGALLTRMDIPLADEIRFAFDRSLKPVVSVAVALRRQGDGWTGRAAIGCAHAEPWAGDIPLADGPGGDPRAAAEACLAAMPEPVTDHHASGAYRRRVAGVLLARKLKELAT